MISSGASGADVVDGVAAGPENIRYSYESSILWAYIYETIGACINASYRKGNTSLLRCCTSSLVILEV